MDDIVAREPLISENRKPQLRRLIYKLIEKLETNENNDFFLFKILRAHILPLTNCAFNKSGDKFITGSYDRTCKIWNTETGEELLTLEGHRNVVYAIAFNNPYGDKVITGSFGATLPSPPPPAFHVLLHCFPSCRLPLLGCFTSLFSQPPSAHSRIPPTTYETQIKRASSGTPRMETCIIRTAGTQRRSSAYLSTRTEPWWQPVRWTTRLVSGTWRLASACTLYWGTLQKS